MLAFGIAWTKNWKGIHNDTSLIVVWDRYVFVSRRVRGAAERFVGK